MGTRIAIVANPTSGRGKGGKLVPQVVGLLRSMGVDHSMHVCAGPADPERLARQAVEDGAEIVVALGGDGQVGLCANRVRFLKGTPKYIPSSFVTLTRFVPGRFEVTVDGEHRRISGMMIAIGNGESYGGGMRITPNAKSDDGMLDLCVIGEVSKLE